MSQRYAIQPSKVPAPGARALLEFEGKSLALVNLSGQFYAIDERYPHPGASLCGGHLQGRVIQHGAHGLRADLASGDLLNSTVLKAGHYPVEVLEGQVFIVIDAEESTS